MTLTTTVSRNKVHKHPSALALLAFNLHPSHTTKSAYILPSLLDGEPSDQIVFDRAFSRQVWEGCAKKLGININFSLESKLWNYFRKENTHTQLVRTLFVVFC